MDAKITELSELTSVATTDLVPIVDDPSGTPVTKKITVDNLTAGSIKNTIVAAKGDLITASANDTPAIITAGTNGQVLMADSNQTNGIQWHDPMTLMARNSLINSNFDVWQRGTTATNPTTFLSDRWAITASADGGTLPTNIVHSRQILTSGDIPNAFYHYRIAPDGAGSSYGTNTQYRLRQRIENGTRFLCGDGKKVTLSFWARSSIANKKLGLFALQVYGSGGSPSAAENIVGTNWTLGSTWTKYTHTFTTNTLASKTFGTANDDTFQVIFSLAWKASSGTNDGYAVNSGSDETFVGSGNIDIAQVQLCAGDVALPFMPKSINDEERDCRRFYRLGMLLGVSQTTSWLSTSVDFATNPARVTPTTSNFKIYTTRANAVAEIAQQTLTRPGVGDTNITTTALQTDIGMGIAAVQMTGTPLTADKAYSGWYVLNMEL